MDITGGLYAHLAAQSGIVSRIGTFAAVPAIFANEHGAPEGYDIKTAGPCIVIPPAFASSNADDWDTKAREVFDELRIYAPASGSSAPINDLAELVRRALHVKSVPVTGARSLTATATGPVAAPTSGPDLFGRAVTVRLSLEEI